MGEPFARPAGHHFDRTRVTSCRLALAVVLLLSGCGANRHSHRGVASPSPRPAPAHTTAPQSPPRVQPELAARRAAARERREIALYAREARRQVGPCFGAAALTTPAILCSAAARNPLMPALSRAPNDKSDAYPSVSGDPTCFSYRPWFPQVTCIRGDPAGSFRVALVGNSHAGQWLPALELIARRRHWRITTFLASNCALAETRQDFQPPYVSTACLDWATTTTARVAAGRFDLVLVTDKMSLTAAGRSAAGSPAAYEVGYARVLWAWRVRHLTVVALRDTPTPWPADPPACLAQHPMHDAACAGRRASWLHADPVLVAARAQHDPQITALDLSADFCTASVCPAVIGRVIVYFDGSHMTATYCRSLAGALEASLVRVIRRE